MLARWLYTQTSAPVVKDPKFSVLDASARSVVAAIVPVMLEGALPEGATTQVRDQVVAGVDRAVAGLPPAVRAEIDQLFSLLAFAPARCLVAGVWSPWSEASRDSIVAFLGRWRDSRFALLRSGFAALRQLILSAWYSNPRAWPAIGYPGPPLLESA